MWNDRTLEQLIADPTALGPFKVLLILGPRQVGKTSILKHCATDSFQYVSFDDLQTRTRASEDPILFSKELKNPLIIDEIQYAPQILPTLKLLADKSTTASPQIWITGSQGFDAMKGVNESLAGRVVILNMLGLSDEEKGIPLSISIQDYFKEIFWGTFPALRTFNSTIDQRERFFSSYVQTYIERDVRELIGIKKRREFEIFLKACALRSGTMLNYDDIAKDSGISSMTAREWINILEDSFILKRINPWFSKKTKRMIKTPKLYFLDCGLCSYLSGFLSPEQVRLSPFGGNIFETHVLCQLERYFRHRGLEARIHFWRTKDGEEIDFIVETKNGITGIEAKLGTPSRGDLIAQEKVEKKGLRLNKMIVLSGAAIGENPASISKDWIQSSPVNLSFLD